MMRNMRKRTKVVLAIAAVVVLGVGAGTWWFLRDDAPPRVSLEAAAQSVTGQTATREGIAGDWAVDAESGTFDFESASGTFAGFRIEEKLTGIGSTTAVGRTGEVSGKITIEGTTLTSASFEVDTASITTNDRRRDDNVQSALSVSRFPKATFALTDPVELGSRSSQRQSRLPSMRQARSPSKASRRTSPFRCKRSWSTAPLSWWGQPTSSSPTTASRCPAARSFCQWTTTASWSSSCSSPPRDLTLALPVRSGPQTNLARSSCLSTLPVALRGSESTISSCSGIFWRMTPASMQYRVRSARRRAAAAVAASSRPRSTRSPLLAVGQPDDRDVARRQDARRAGLRPLSR